MTIAKRLSLLITIAVLALVLLGGGSIFGLKQLQGKLDSVNDNLLPSIILLNEITQDMFRMRLRLQSHVMSDDMDKQKAFEEDLIKLGKRVDEELEQYEKQMVVDETDRKMAEDGRAAIAAYRKLAAEVLTMSKNLMKTDAQHTLLENNRIAVNATETLTKHVKYNVELANADKTASQQLAGRLTTGMIILALLAIVGVGFLGSVIYRNVVTSLNSLRETLVDVERNLDFTRRAPVMSNDEVGATVEAVNRLTTRLQESLRQIADQSDRVTEAAKRLTETAHIVTESASSQSASAADMAATVEEMTVSINHVADQAGEANRLSGESGSLAVDGEKTIVETVEDINLIASTVRDASSYVADLDRDSQRVNEVIGVIKEIADQTNLLALNAAIEAARAGEQGRGFAVVADEVRKLAERTSQSTQVIAETIAAMQVNAQNTVEGMKAVDERVTIGVERANAANTANTAITQIRASSGRAVDRVGEISNAIREQGIASTSIAQQVEKIAQMSEENHAAAENTSATAEELDALAHRMKEIVSQYKV
ncbi:MAG: methyl-accepting chemotaxis protein [Rhodocyclaceae bacterium]|nr:methyl-accepting chemotaxis protein [Rhodocyclaceae bacterium]